MNKDNSTEKRRHLLKAIAAGSGVIIAGKSLPDSWSRPVVDAVMIPAHAQTSAVAPIICGPSSLTSASVYYSVDVNTGACSLSATPPSDPNRAFRLNPLGGGNIPINVNGNWTVIAGGTSVDGSNPQGAQSIALRSNVSSNSFMLSFTALDNGATVAVSNATVQIL